MFLDVNETVFVRLIEFLSSLSQFMLWQGGMEWGAEEEVTILYARTFQADSKWYFKKWNKN